MTNQIKITCAKYANKKGYECWIKEGNETIAHYENVELTVY